MFAGGDRNGIIRTSVHNFGLSRTSVSTESVTRCDVAADQGNWIRRIGYYGLFGETSELIVRCLGLREPCAFANLIFASNLFIILN